MNLGDVVSYFFFQLLVPLLFTVSVATFLWGVCLHYVAGGADGELSERGKTLTLYGLLALVVTMVIYGLLSLMRAQVG